MSDLQFYSKMAWSSVCVLSILLAFNILAFDSFAFGESSLPGRQCGDNTCLTSEARCMDGECECVDGQSGDGQLSCHSQEAEVCSLTPASFLTDFNLQELAEVNSPCRYLTAILETTSRDHPSVDCKIRVYAHGERTIGHFFTRGFDAVVLSGDSYAGYRGRGTYSSRQGYSYELETRNDPDATWGDVTSIQTDDVTFDLDEDDQRVILKVIPCGLSLYFRVAVPTEGKMQTAKSGLVISVDPHQARITWLPTKDGICLDRTRTMMDVKRELGLDTAWSAIRYLAFTNSEKSVHPSSPQQCDDVSNTLSRCNNAARRRRALERCDFILRVPQFLKCYEDVPDGSMSERTMILYDKCLSAFCRGNRSKCTSVVNIIKRAECESKARDGVANMDCDSA